MYKFTIYHLPPPLGITSTTGAMISLPPRLTMVVQVLYIGFIGSGNSWENRDDGVGNDSLDFHYAKSMYTTAALVASASDECTLCRDGTFNKDEILRQRRWIPECMRLPIGRMCALPTIENKGFQIFKYVSQKIS